MEIPVLPVILLQRTDGEYPRAIAYFPDRPAIYDLGRLARQGEPFAVRAGWASSPDGSFWYRVRVERPVEVEFVVRFATEATVREIWAADGFTLATPWLGASFLDVLTFPEQGTQLAPYLKGRGA